MAHIVLYYNQPEMSYEFVEVGEGGAKTVLLKYTHEDLQWPLEVLRSFTDFLNGLPKCKADKGWSDG